MPFWLGTVKQEVLWLLALGRCRRYTHAFTFALFVVGLGT